MRWNWQPEDWPDFRYDEAALAGLEARFLVHSGVLLGTLRHLGDSDKSEVTVDLISTEAIKAMRFSAG